MLQRASTQPRPRLFSAANQRTRCSGRRRTSTSCRIHTCCDRWRAYTSAARGGSRRAGTWQSRQARTTGIPRLGRKGDGNNCTRTSTRKALNIQTENRKRKRPQCVVNGANRCPKQQRELTLPKPAGLGTAAAKDLRPFVRLHGCRLHLCEHGQHAVEPLGVRVQRTQERVVPNSGSADNHMVLQPAKWVVAAAGRTIRCRG